MHGSDVADGSEASERALKEATRKATLRHLKVAGKAAAAVADIEHDREAHHKDHSDSATVRTS